MPLWLATEIRPGGGYGATICAHIDTGVEMTPCPFGPASRMPSAFADRDQLALERAALLARLAVAAARDERRAHALLRARAQELHVGLVRRAHEDQVGGAVGQLVDRAVGRLAEHLGAVAVHGEDARPHSRSGAGCAARRSRTCPGGVDAPATMMPRG